MPLEVGAVAPDFALRDQHGATVSLSDFRGQRHVLVFFYPWSFTGICTGELRALRDDVPALERAGVQVLAVSCDSMFTQRVFSDREDLSYPVLSDFWPHGAVASAYGVFEASSGTAVRGSFLVDREGVVRWRVVNPIGIRRELADVHDAVRALGGTRADVTAVGKVS